MVAAPPAISFFVSGKPQTKGSLVPNHLWGPMLYDPKAGKKKPTCRVFLREDRGARLTEWRALVATAAKNAMRHDAPFEGPVRVRLTFYFERPKSHTKAERLVSWVFTRGRDDIDKLSRAVLDAMTDAAVWLDDGQVSELLAGKHYMDSGYGPENRPAGVSAVVEAL